MSFCDCDLRDRRWNPSTGKCEFCGRKYNDSRSWDKFLATAPSDPPGGGFLLAGRDPSGKLGHHEAESMSEDTFLQEYREKVYPKPSVTVDLVIFSVADADLKVLLIKRKGHPFKDCWALPGGFVNVGDAVKDQGESLTQAAHRELAEETGLPQGSCFLEQLYTFGDPGRDPRTRVISVAYFSLVPSDLMPLVKAGDDAADARWFSIKDRDGTKDLAFDHGNVLQVGLRRLRGRIDYDPVVAIQLLPRTFTIYELRAVYEAVKGDKYDPSNFRRRFKRLLEDEQIEEAPGKRNSERGRPSKVYSLTRPKT